MRDEREAYCMIAKLFKFEVPHFGTEAFALFNERNLQLKKTKIIIRK